MTGGPSRWVGVRLAALALLLPALACGADSPAEPNGDGGNGNGDDPGTIAIALGSSALEIEQGSDASTTLTLVRAGAFSGAVTLSASGVPAGVTAAFAPSQIGAGSTSSTLTVVAAQDVASGEYELTVRATGVGVADATATLDPAGFLGGGRI